MAAGWYPGRCKDCAELAAEGSARCAECAPLHNAREQARRDERKRKHQCRVCGQRATKDEAGNLLSTCAVHLEYYRARA